MFFTALWFGWSIKFAVSDLLELYHVARALIGVFLSCFIAFLDGHFLDFIVFFNL